MPIQAAAIAPEPVPSSLRRDSEDTDKGLVDFKLFSGMKEDICTQKGDRGLKRCGAKIAAYPASVLVRT